MAPKEFETVSDFKARKIGSGRLIHRDGSSDCPKFDECAESNDQ
jgi:hypothetical protein